MERSSWDLTQAPVAAAMFLRARNEGMDEDDLADPVRVTILLAATVRSLDPWAGGSSMRRQAAVAEAGAVRAVVDRVLADPRNAWWTASLNRSEQMLLTDPSTSRGLLGQRATGDWEVYAQKPARRLQTSTEIRGSTESQVRSGLHAELGYAGSDWSPTYPLGQSRLLFPDSARVYEVQTPSDWHALATGYMSSGRYKGPDRNLLLEAGIDHGLAPSWSAVAADWDGVHLSFYGVLSTLYRRIESRSGSTTLWTWLSEQTLWLRDLAIDATPLPDLEEDPL